MVDIFTKFVSIIPIKTRDDNTLLDAMKESILKMGENLRHYTQMTKGE